jgi:hypothetical protein
MTELIEWLTHGLGLPLASEIRVALNLWYEWLTHSLGLPLASEIIVALNWWCTC